MLAKYNYFVLNVLETAWAVINVWCQTSTQFSTGV